MWSIGKDSRAGQAGFTLLEVLAAVALIGLVLAVALEALRALDRTVHRCEVAQSALVQQLARDVPSFEDFFASRRPVSPGRAVP